MTGEIVIRVSALIFIAGLGWITGFVLNLRSRDISVLLIYIISPVVIFISILQSPADWSYLGYSAAAFSTASLAAGIAYLVGGVLWQDGRVNLFAFAGGTGNTGYFGLPLVFAVFNERQVAIAVFIIIGLNIYEFTCGYFITARAFLTIKESLKCIVRLPVIYAAIAGMAFKALKIAPGEIVLSTLSNFKGAYSVLGMMVIGITLAAYRKIELDRSFLLATIGWKHIVYPLVGIGFFHILTGVSARTLAVIALMLASPMAANTVVVANTLGVHPEKVALAVMVSTLLAIITTPLAMAWVNGLTG
ncbi:MAG: AEC family transporter [Hyphomicrobiales bacterium]